MLNVSENSRGLQQFDIGFNNKLGPTFGKGWLAIAKLKPLLLFISLLSMPKTAFDNVKIEK